jgi:hypothetical protein
MHGGTSSFLLNHSFGYLPEAVEITMKSNDPIEHAQPSSMTEQGDAEETPCATTDLKSDTISMRQFCALAYVPQLKPRAQWPIEHIILVVVKRADGDLEFRAHPNLHQVVEATNLSYVISLLEEFLICAKYHAEQLFGQLCAKHSGPLLPWKVGESIDEHPDIRDIAMRFLPF